MLKVFRFTFPFGVALLVLCVGLVLVDASVVAGQPNATSLSTLIVNTLEDELIIDGDCSIREAIKAANTNTVVDACGSGDVLTDTITFGVAGTIYLTEPLTVTAEGPLLIDGVDAVTISGGGSVRIFFVDEFANLTLQSLSLVDGQADYGGGIYNDYDGTLTITDSTLSGNKATEDGGGIYSDGNLTISGSTLSGNSAIEGGGINNYGLLTITDSTLLENSAYVGGGIENAGVLTITNSTLSDNSATQWGGGIVNWHKVTLTETTLSENSATVGGGIYNGDRMTITNSTLSENSATNGGGIYNDSYGMLTITNSIIANSILADDCYSDTAINDGGHNISSDDTCGFSTANDSLPDTDPKLGALQDNGGATFTHALLVGSPAIDAADDTYCSETDQRGFFRPADGDGDGTAVCDIGSYEYQVPPSLVTITGSLAGLIQQPYNFTATVEPLDTTLPITYTWQVEGQTDITHTDGLTDAATFTWNIPGVYKLTVSAANIAGSVSDIHSITITDQPITGLEAYNDSPTVLGEVTTLSATVTGGTNVVYTWDFGDDEVGSGHVVTHTYAETGVYTATVTAHNATNSISATTMVTITAEVPSNDVYLPLVIKE